MNREFPNERRMSSRVRYAAMITVPFVLVIATTAIVRANVPNVFKDGDTLSAQLLNDNISSLDNRISEIEQSASPPSGMISAFAGTTPPNGWLPCDGTLLDGTNPKFASLYAAIGTSYGGSKTSRQFNIPDLRGRFIRGWDQGSTHDPDATTREAVAAGGNSGDMVGTVQADSFRLHEHPLIDPGHSHSMSQSFLCGAGSWTYGGNNWACQIANDQTNVAVTNTTGVHMQAVGGSETRPANVSVNYVIKL